MIDIATALYNIMHSRFGRDVRQSIHDGISQINDNANEALANARTMGVGDLVTDTTSSSEGYVSGNLYLNTTTWDLWQCVGTNSWLNTGNIKGETGAKGTDGVNNFIFIRYSAHYDGTDFTATPTASSQYIGVYYGQSRTAPNNKQDYQWTSYVGTAGTNAYVYIRYSESPDGSNLVDEPTPLTKYIGFYAGSSASAPAGKQYYTWSEYVGKSGSGSGDMLASEYAPSGVTGTVDKAIDADNATNATNATNSTNLMKTNGDIITADTVSTKIDQIGDEWVNGGTYAIGSYAIYENALYKCIGNGGGSAIPDVSPTVWTATKIDDALTSLNDTLGDVQRLYNQLNCTLDCYLGHIYILSLKGVYGSAIPSLNFSNYAPNNIMYATGTVHYGTNTAKYILDMNIDTNGKIDATYYSGNDWPTSKPTTGDFKWYGQFIWIK